MSVIEDIPVMALYGMGNTSNPAQLCKCVQIKQLNQCCQKFGTISHNQLYRCDIDVKS